MQRGTHTQPNVAAAETPFRGNVQETRRTGSWIKWQSGQWMKACQLVAGSLSRGSILTCRVLVRHEARAWSSHTEIDERSSCRGTKTISTRSSKRCQTLMHRHTSKRYPTPFRDTSVDATTDHLHDQERCKTSGREQQTLRSGRVLSSESADHTSQRDGSIEGVWEETQFPPPHKRCSRNHHNTTRQHHHSRKSDAANKELALWSSLTLETGSHWWITAGHPLHTSVHHGGETVGGSAHNNKKTHGCSPCVQTPQPTTTGVTNQRIGGRRPKTYNFVDMLQAHYYGFKYISSRKINFLTKKITGKLLSVRKTTCFFHSPDVKKSRSALPSRSVSPSPLETHAVCCGRALRQYKYCFQYCSNTVLSLFDNFANFKGFAE